MTGKHAINELLLVMTNGRRVEGTAKGGGEDFEDAYGELEFKNDETV